jgi:hypothetical protein
MFFKCDLFALTPIADPTPYDLAVFHGLNDLVDLFYLELFADQPFQHEIPFHGHIRKPRYVQMGVDIAI